MTVMHLSECGKEKLKTGTSFPRKGNPEHVFIARRRSRRGNPGQQTAGLLHFVRNDGMHLRLAGLLHCVRNDGSA